MNEMQEAMLKIAKEFIKVCEKLNLKYFAVYGTTIGAVRHNGFIPWDDDMDFCMPRKDYEKLLSEGQQYFPPNFFIESKQSEKDWWMIFSRIRDSNTTAIQKRYLFKNFNHGIWIDIFPIDIAPNSIEKANKLNKKECRFAKRRYLEHYYDHTRFNRITDVITKILFPSKSIAYNYSRRITNKYNNKNSNYVWLGSFRNKLVFNKEIFEEQLLVPFEDIMISVPKKYDEFLTSIYGDWKKLPPENQRIGHHGCIFVSTKESYIKFLNKFREEYKK
ncbi:MAG: LicD family protein [archaeon]|nr:LicD family protein [Bacilli bacterium]MCQ2976438.1 LicD family protein [archaeon]